MKKSIIIGSTIALSTLIFAGCTTPGEIDALKAADVQTNQRVNAVDKKTQDLKKQLDELDSNRRATLEKTLKDLADLQKMKDADENKVAEAKAAVESAQNEVKKVKDMLAEFQRAKEKDSAKIDELEEALEKEKNRDTLRAQVENIDARLAEVENGNNKKLEKATKELEALRASKESDAEKLALAEEAVAKAQAALEASKEARAKNEAKIAELNEQLEKAKTSPLKVTQDDVAKLKETQVEQDKILAETDAVAVKQAKDEAAKLKETQAEDAKKLAEAQAEVAALQASQLSIAEQLEALNKKLSLTGAVALREAHMKMAEQFEAMSRRIAMLEANQHSTSKNTTSVLETSLGNSAALGGKNDVLLRNNLVYRPKLDFGKTKIAGTGVSTNSALEAMKKTNLKASVFNGLTKLEQAALCDAIDNACKQAGADMLMDPVWTFKQTEKKQLVCEVSGRPAFVVGYDVFTPLEVMQEYVDFIDKNKLRKKEVVFNKSVDNNRTIIENVARDSKGEVIYLEKFSLKELFDFVVLGEMGNFGSKSVEGTNNN